MSLHVVRDISSILEPLLLAATLWAFAQGKSYRRLPAFGAYLICRMVVCASLLALLYASRLHLVEKHLAYHIYYYFYWVGYLIGAGLTLLVIQEIFGHLMRPLPGLGRYGLMAFRWVTLTSVLISLATALYPVAPKRDLLVAATSGAMRCMSILELCLLAFIAVSMHTLRFSARSREFGVALGLGTIAAADLFGSAFAFGHSTLASVASYGSQVVVTLGAMVWMFYFAKPNEEAENTQGASPSMQRWNEIAGALTHSAPQIALTPSPNFFLRDVEKAVDRVLERNSANQNP